MGRAEWRAWGYLKDGAQLRSHGARSVVTSSSLGANPTGFGMAIEILLASFIVSTLLVPALTAMIGERAWWPSEIARDTTPQPRESLHTLRPVADSK